MLQGSIKNYKKIQNKKLAFRIKNIFLKGSFSEFVYLIYFLNLKKLFTLKIFSKRHHKSYPKEIHKGSKALSLLPSGCGTSYQKILNK